jgi:hypothetical protein
VEGRYQEVTICLPCLPASEEAEKILGKGVLSVSLFGLGLFMGERMGVALLGSCWSKQIGGGLIDTRFPYTPSGASSFVRGVRQTGGFAEAFFHCALGMDYELWLEDDMS